MFHKALLTACVMLPLAGPAAAGEFRTDASSGCRVSVADRDVAFSHRWSGRCAPQGAAAEQLAARYRAEGNQASAAHYARLAEDLGAQAD